ncbi:MAG TPA: hypothetical protein VHU85_09075 [Acidimicrobiales bacterium]|nr:hypothetical protein [Acidimicrobiales bacterium]
MALRVVQWTTGIVGSAALRAILDDPRLELVGVYAFDRSKVGVDAATLAGTDGRPPTGVRAADDIDALLPLKADCVVYMPQWPDIAILERILESGTNVITTARLVTGVHYPDGAGERLARAAEWGGVTLFGTGMNPTYVPTLALAATAMCRRVTRISVTESLDCALYGAAPTWEAYGFGAPLEPERLKSELWAAEPDYREILDVMAAALDVTLDAYTLDVDYAAASEDRDLGFMTIAQGTVAALDARWVGRVHGAPFVEMRTTWKLGSIFGYHQEPDWPLLYGYRIDIDGDPEVHLKLNFMPADLDNLDVGVTTALPAINAIPAVCAAPPGIVTAADLPLVTGRGSPGAVTGPGTSAPASG